MAPSKSILHKSVIDHLAKIGRADILVGIPSFRNASTIVDVVKAASDGLATYFPKLKAVIVNSDGGSEDNTKEVVLNTPVAPGIDKIVTEYRGLAGKGSAFHTIFEIADRLHVKVCIVVDSDLRSIKADWIRLLGEPVQKHNYGFVTPYYMRYKYDGTITNTIAYPLTRALYGQMIRQPIGGEFALSGSLAKIFAHQNVWKSDIAKFGIDIWMTTTAICEGFRICQSSMGVKLHDLRDPSSDLEPMFHEVVGTALDLMKKYDVKWQEVTESKPTEIFGQMRNDQPEPFAINLAGLLEHFHDELRQSRSILEQILQPDSLAGVEKLKTISKTEVFNLPDDLWAKIVYDHAVAYNFPAGPTKPEVITALKALFSGRTAAFVLATEVMESVQAEKAVLKAAEAFEDQKPYLIRRWNAAKNAKKKKTTVHIA